MSYMSQESRSCLGPVTGIIAEYNPFHNGHAFHIQEAKRLCNASCCVVVMSGDFVQRGEPAIFDKYARTFMALSSGADLVVEMPPAFALASAEDFAACGVALLESMGIVSHLCFGSECGRIAPLMDLARILALEPEPFRETLRREATSGLSYPKARQKALAQYLASRQMSTDPASLLSSPNNTLGVEYLKALLKQDSPIIPVTIARQGAGYHDQCLSAEYSSATAIRKRIFELYQCREHNTARHGVPAPDAPGQNAPDWALQTQVPSSCLETIRTAVPVCTDDFSLLLSYRLLELSQQAAGLDGFADVSPELALRIARHTLNFSSFEERIADIKTRQYTYTRISRCLMHILLNITHANMDSRKRLGYGAYLRILGFRRDSAPLLGEIKRCSRLPIVTKTADAPRILSPQALESFNHDLFCSHMYQSVVQQKTCMRPKNEYTRSLVIV